MNNVRILEPLNLETLSIGIDKFAKRKSSDKLMILRTTVKPPKYELGCTTFNFVPVKADPVILIWDCRPIVLDYELFTTRSSWSSEIENLNNMSFYNKIRCSVFRIRCAVPFLTSRNKLSVVVKMDLFSLQSSEKKNNFSLIKRIGSSLIFTLFLLNSFYLPLSNAIENNPLGVPDDELADIVNPLKSDCYDWRGNPIPCLFKRQYAELLLEKHIPDPRFMDNNDGTVTDNLSGLVWLKNTNCFEMMDWEGAKLAVNSLKDGDCGPDPALILTDGSSAGEWRLPTMSELCTLIDFSRRDPALPSGHAFSDFPSGYHWSATTLDYHSGMAWIVYFESGTTCYEGVTNQAGHILPVRKSLE